MSGCLVLLPRTLVITLNLVSNDQFSFPFLIFRKKLFREDVTKIVKPFFELVVLNQCFIIICL